MPQRQLPIFPAGVTEINNSIAVQKEAGQVVYIHGHLPVFHHDEEDVGSFRMFTSQMIVNGTVKPKEIVKAGAARSTAKRRWETQRRVRWNVSQRRWGCWQRRRSNSKRRGMCRKAACCWHCQRCWRKDCCAIARRCITCPTDSTESIVSFCSWHSWPWRGFGPWNSCVIKRRASGAKSWDWIASRKCGRYGKSCDCCAGIWVRP